MEVSTKYYSITEAAKMLRVSRPTIYACIKSGEIKAVRVSERTIRIPETEFPSVAVRYSPTPQKIDKDKMMTKEEALEKYELKQAYFYRRVKAAKIEVFRYGAKTYYYKSDIKRLFNKPKNDIIWTTSEALSEQFGISRKRVCELARQYGIPTQRAGAVMKIDKEGWMKHKVELPNLEKNYLTVDQAKELYHIGQKRFYDEVNAHQITKLRQGREVYFLKSELDELFKPKKIPIEIKRKGMTSKEALKHYHIGQKRFIEETKAAGVTKIRTIGNFVYYNKEELDKLFKQQ